MAGPCQAAVCPWQSGQKQHEPRASLAPVLLVHSPPSLPPLTMRRRVQASTPVAVPGTADAPDEGGWHLEPGDPEEFEPGSKGERDAAVPGGFSYQMEDFFQGLDGECLTFMYCLALSFSRPPPPPLHYPMLFFTRKSSAGLFVRVRCLFAPGNICGALTATVNKKNNYRWLGRQVGGLVLPALFCVAPLGLDSTLRTSSDRVVRVAVAFLFNTSFSFPFSAFSVVR